MYEEHPEYRKDKKKANNSLPNITPRCSRESNDLTGKSSPERKQIIEEWYRLLEKEELKN